MNKDGRALYAIIAAISIILALVFLSAHGSANPDPKVEIAKKIMDGQSIIEVTYRMEGIELNQTQWVRIDEVTLGDILRW